MDDIPYLDADFMCAATKKWREETPEGPVQRSQEKCSLHRASCTFWEPSEEERLVIATGGNVQVLDFRGGDPLISVNAMWLRPPAYPKNAPVYVAIARTMYAEGREPGAPQWDDLPPNMQALWTRRARKAHEVFSYWKRND